MLPEEAIEKILIDADGVAITGHVLREISDFPVEEWSTEALIKAAPSMLEGDRFFRIRPNLFGLKAMEGKILKTLNLKTESMQESFDHSYYQGLLMEIGLMKGLDTHLSKKNAKRKFLHESLGSLSVIDGVFPFSFEHIIEKAAEIDILWFNKRQFIASAFEVEYGHNFEPSLDKFLHLQDFNISFYIVGPHKRRREFEKFLANPKYHTIESRVKYADHRYVAAVHTKSCEYEALHPASN